MAYGLTALAMAVFLWPGGAIATPSADVSVIVRVLSCTTGGDMPNLWLWPLKRGREPAIAPYWTHQGGVWNGKISVPAGHYILHGSTTSCMGRGEQFVAIPGSTRHVTLALNKATRGVIATMDENMYAGAIYGTLPADDAGVAVWSLDDATGPTSMPVRLDGNTFEVGHLRPGKFAVVVTVGEVGASRVVSVHGYGDAVDATMSVGTAQRIVALQAAGFGEVRHPYGGPYGYYSTYELGAGVVDGWTTPVSAALEGGDVHLSAYAVAAVELVRASIGRDVTLTPAFRTLSAWTVEVEGYTPKYMWVTLRPVDTAAWAASGSNGAFCLDGAENSYEVDLSAGGKVEQRPRCYH